MPCLIDVDYWNRDGWSIIREWWKHEDGTVRFLEKPDFRPYILWHVPKQFAQEGDEAHVATVGVWQRAKAARADVLSVENVQKLVGQEKQSFLKLNLRSTVDAVRMRQAAEGMALSFEDDIPFPFRYLMDSDVRLFEGLKEVGGLRIMSVDLEIVFPPALKSARAERDPISAIAVAWEQDGQERSVVLEGEEREQLAALAALINSVDPDAIVTYNGNDFDWPYIAERCAILKAPFNIGRDGSALYVNRFEPVASGRLLVDLLPIVRRDIDTVKVKTLKNVCDALDIMRTSDRIIVEFQDMYRVWNEDHARMIQYARDDAVSTLRLGKNLISKMVPFCDHLLACARLVDASHSGRGRQVEMVLSARSVRCGRLIPPRPSNPKDFEYDGAMVLDSPVKGLEEGVELVDFAATYPRIIIDYNISPDTLCVDQVCKREHWTSPTDDRFHKTGEGFVCETMRSLIAVRKPWKAKLNDVIEGSAAWHDAYNWQDALKKIANCFSGDTEVMTPSGPVNVKDLHIGDVVYSINPRTRAVEVKPVVATIVQDYDGEMISVKNDYYDFVVTPNHRFWVGTYEEPFSAHFVEAAALRPYQRYRVPYGTPVPGTRQVAFEFPERAHTTERAKEVLAAIRNSPGLSQKQLAADLGMTSPGVAFHIRNLRRIGSVERVASRRQGGHSVSSSILPSNGTLKEPAVVSFGPGHRTIPRKYAMDDWLQFLAWFVTEGSAYQARRKEYANGNIRGASKSVHISQKTEPGRKEIRKLLVRMGLRFSEGSGGFTICNAIIYDWLCENCGIGSANKRFPEWVFSLDSDQRELFLFVLMFGDGSVRSGRRYTTTSLALRNQVARLVVELGYKPLLRSDSGVYRVLYSRNIGSMRPIETLVRVPNTDGRVYCVTVADNHTVLAGRNGTFQWCGQSTYGLFGWTQSRWANLACARSVAAWGVAHVKEALAVATKPEAEGGFGLEVLYGDTDSLFVRGKKLEEFVKHVNSSMRASLEYKGPYVLVFFTGVKKRYAGLKEQRDKRTGEVKQVIEVKGLETKRGDWSALARETQDGVLDRVLRHRDFRGAVELARTAVRAVVAKDVPREKLLVYKSLRRPEEYTEAPAHAKAAFRELDDDAIADLAGDKVPFVVLRGDYCLVACPKCDPERKWDGTGAPPDRGCKKCRGVCRVPAKNLTDRLRMAEHLRPEEWEFIDWNYYVEKQALPAALRILEGFKVDGLEVNEDMLTGQPVQRRLFA